MSITTQAVTAEADTDSGFELGEEPYHIELY